MITLKRTYGLKDELARFKKGDYVIFKTYHDLRETPCVDLAVGDKERDEIDFVPDRSTGVSADWDIVTNKMWRRLGGELAKIDDVEEDGEVFLKFEDEDLTEFASGYTIQTWMVKHPFGEGEKLPWYTPWERTKLDSIDLTSSQKKALGEKRIYDLLSNASVLCDRKVILLPNADLENPLERESGVVCVFCPDFGEEYETLPDFLRSLSVEEMDEVEIKERFYDKYKQLLFSEWEKRHDGEEKADDDDDDFVFEPEVPKASEVPEDSKDRSVCAFLRVGDKVKVRDNYPADWKFEGGGKGLHCNLETLKLLYSGFDAVVEEVFADGVSLSFWDGDKKMERLTWKAEQGGLVFPFWCLEFMD